MVTVKHKLQRPSVRSGALVAMVGVAVVFGLSVKLSSRAATLPGDLNNDGVVNIYDLSMLLSNWGRTGTGDINGDGTVNVFDLSSLLSNWGKTSTSTPTPVSTPTPAATPVSTATISLNDASEGTGLNQFNFNGSWSISTPGSAYMGDNHFSNTTGNYYQVQFAGTQAKIYAEKGPADGIVGVSVDGGSETMVDAYAAVRAEQQLLYSSPVLASGANHTIKVRITGTKNASSSATYSAADRIDVSGVIVTPTPFGQTPTPVPYCAGKTPCYGPKDLAMHATNATCWGYNLTWMFDLAKFAPAHKNGPGNILTPVSCGHDISGLLNGTVNSNGTHYHKVETINNYSYSIMASYRVGYYDPAKP